ncbi:hypothetical protein K1719_008515 [Acacia pycnantha]|nr:hypothetical protein K1719_008515 [Acacia pycnantha]
MQRTIGPALLDTCCEVIGSCIYVIGGLSVMCRRQYQVGDDEGSAEPWAYAVNVDDNKAIEERVKGQHTRLVPLLGHCLENDNAKFLSLDWITRLKVSIGTTEALCYLHHECNPPFVHRDIQASSILLDDKYEVRLGSLSEACTQEGDTHQRRISRLLRLPQSSDQGSSGSSQAVCAYDACWLWDQAR